MTPTEAWDVLRNRATDVQRGRLDRAVASLLEIMRDSFPQPLPTRPDEGDTFYDRTAQTMWMYDGREWYVLDNGTTVVDL